MVRGDRSAFSRSVVGGASLWLASRIFVTVVALLARATDPSAKPRPGGLPRLLFAWDSNYYFSIAASGYFSGGDRAKLPAFFPGYPLLAGLVARALGFLDDPVGLALALVSALGGLAAAVLLWSLIAHEASTEVAFAGVLLFVFGPYALFLHASYSEPLFLAFAIASWYAGRRGSWWISGLCAAAASLTRANGLFLVAALLVMYVVERRRSGQPIRSVSLLGPTLGLLGTAGYLGWLWHHTHLFNAWGQAEAVGWGRRSRWPWDSLRSTVSAMFHREQLDAHIQFAFDIVFGFGAALIAAWLVRRREWASFTYVTLTLGALMTSTTWMSLARNTLTLFPIQMAFAGLFASGGVHRRRFTLILGLSVALLAFNTRQFAVGGWAD